MTDRDDPRAALQPLDVEASLKAANQRLRRDLATERDARRRAELERDVARAGLAAAIPLLGEASVGEVRAAMLLHQPRPRPRIVAAQEAATAPTAPEPGQRVSVIDPAGPHHQRQAWAYNPRTSHWEIEDPGVPSPGDPPAEVSIEPASKNGPPSAGATATAGASAAVDGRGEAVGALPDAQGQHVASGPRAEEPMGVAADDPTSGAVGAREGGGRRFGGVLRGRRQQRGDH